MSNSSNGEGQDPADVVKSTRDLHEAEGGGVWGEVSLDEVPIKWVLNVNNLTRKGLAGEKQATSEELQLLTQMLSDDQDLEITSLTCTYAVKPRKNASKLSHQEFVGQFHLRADLRQTCVVTLERLEGGVEEHFSQDFTSAGGPPSSRGQQVEQIDDLLGEEPPVPLIKGQINVGPLVYQYLSMAIDPNPRKPGAAFEDNRAKACAHEKRPPSPFVVLKDYKPKK